MREYPALPAPEHHGTKMLEFANDCIKTHVYNYLMSLDSEEREYHIILGLEDGKCLEARCTLTTWDEINNANK